MTPLKGDGSNRSFFRMSSGAGFSRSYVVMWNPPADKKALHENLAYDRIGKHLEMRRVPVPQIHHADHQSGCIIMEDLGDVSLKAYVDRVDDPLPIFDRVLDVLVHLQVEGAMGFDARWCCQTPRYDRTVMTLLEALYFKESFLRRYTGMSGDLDRLDGCFFHCAEVASQCSDKFFLHRDFQSRNIMICEGEVRIIDWQGGRFGPPGYDIASLAIDPYTDLPDGRRDLLIENYASMICKKAPCVAEAFRKTYPYLALQRNMQILGAFAHLSRVMGKMEFEAYIAPALKRLKLHLEDMSDPALLPLGEALKKIDPSEMGIPGRFQDNCGMESNCDSLNRPG
jgi:N-acetylmuramate 1-kinase